ncbi:3-keto-5-aminohexanoate cleavage protein [Halomonas sp. EGI 63088]|uniref:3-keto-5-aminohexanoate cleavage protein n=1 Tax=Halomonas flagellata TaxID=2920385 RepID=A0ABS9RYB8_9GAMM|nr:3-keto-5-aminohexanoate cleavage protein [Halomonas flagellata]MCH4564867.1 3-keto-5-aminohexanoate cleavage protein [Halomonas flagellata]
MIIQIFPTFHTALVKRVAEMCERYERPVATWQQAREILQLDMP